jgi:methylenetetrahydrofolate reductase (NADPH)
VNGAAEILGRDHARFEILPVSRGEERAAELPSPAWLTVTCSPRHGPDRTVSVACKVRRYGHAVTVHLAARMVRDSAHLNELLARMAEAGVDDILLIGGDATPPHGRFSSAVELLPVIAEHPRRPRAIGVAGYPEGHPLVDRDRLADALRAKASFATYITTQLCFDPNTVLAWVRETRERGLALPVLVGVPGVVDRRRLLELALRVGVGASVSYVRRQRGLLGFLARSRVTPERLHDAIAPHVDDGELNLAGFHYFTFNQLVETWRWERDARAAKGEEAVA